MNRSLKLKMFGGLTVAIIMIQTVLIFAATIFIDDFLLYREVSEFELALELIEIEEDVDEFILMEDLRGSLGGAVFIYTAEGVHDPKGMQREIMEEAYLVELVEKYEASDEMTYIEYNGQDVFIVGQISDGYYLVNQRNMTIIADMKRILNIYLGISTVVVFSILFFCIYHYINYFERRMTFEAQKEILYSLGETADAHFAENGEHIERVSQMMYRFSRTLGYSKKESEMLKIASTMHDIGKIAIPDHILMKPGKLTKEEFEIMKRHTLEGKRILGNSQLPILQMATTIAMYHHERVDGKGYPYQLRSENIPLSAKMMSIVDVYDALTNNRVYKDAMSQEEAMEIIRKASGRQFDEELCRTFFSNMSYIVDF